MKLDGGLCVVISVPLRELDGAFVIESSKSWVICSRKCERRDELGRFSRQYKHGHPQNDS